jgi:transcriptional regulator of heat shock response
MYGLNQRHAQLLSGLVSRYIETGEPIGSQTLAQYLRVSFSPATVRAALQELDEEGYLEQPHTSAGRIPTDRGFRFYVDHSEDRALETKEKRRIERALLERARERMMPQHTVVKVLAELAHTVAVAVDAKPFDVRSTGMNELLERLQNHELEVAREVTALITAVEESAAELARQAAETAVVYIGTENPLLPARHTSLIARAVRLPGGTALVLVAGPKRMHYQHNRALLNYIAQILPVL